MVLLLVIFSFIISSISAYGLLNSSAVLADTVNGQSIDTPEIQSFLDRYSEVYKNVNFERVANSSTYKMLIGNEMDNVKGYELSGKNYIVHLLYCGKSSDSCIFRVNGVNTKRIYSPGTKDLTNEFDIDGEYKLTINSIEFDYCGDVGYCNLHYEAFDRVNVEVVRE